MRTPHTHGAPDDQKVVTPADGGAPNALFGNSFANMLWVGISGNVQIRKIDGRSPASGTGNAVVVPQVTPGEWHLMAPFSNVDSTNTTASNVMVGVSASFWD